jgi:hypothetical protein
MLDAGPDASPWIPGPLGDACTRDDALRVLSVSLDGSGDFTSIQACADAAGPGDFCEVHEGSYPEHVSTAAGGTAADCPSRIVFKAAGAVVMQGFTLEHPFVTVDGFDITGYTVGYQGQLTVYPGGSGCQLFNNRVRDGAPDVYGIMLYPSQGDSPDDCVVAGNRLDNLSYQFMNLSGGGHLVEGNVFENLNGWDALRVFGHDSVVRRNVFRHGVPQPGIGNHPDWVQTFPEGGEAVNMLFEENWIEDLDSQLGQINCGTTDEESYGLVDNIHDFTFRRNVIATISANMNAGIPGVTFESNTFYKAFYTLSGIAFGGSLTRGDASRATVKNNAFVESGEAPDPYGYRGYYFMAGGVFSEEVLRLHLGIDDATATGIFDDMVTTGYIDSNGGIQEPARALTDSAQFVLAAPYASYEAAVYELLVRTVALDTAMRETFVADYNFVAGAAADGFPPKDEHAGDEAHGINGGDPMFADPSDPMGPDGVPFTEDDGLRPLPGSPLCGAGENGADIGALRCD